MGSGAGSCKNQKVATGSRGLWLHLILTGEKGVSLMKKGIWFLVIMCLPAVFSVLRDDPSDRAPVSEYDNVAKRAYEIRMAIDGAEDEYERETLEVKYAEILHTLRAIAGLSPLQDSAVKTVCMTPAD
jgi:hypothetical protein